MTVKHEHKQYKARVTQWKRMRDTVAGQDAIHAAGPLYLPRLTEEPEPDYAARKLRSPFYNATWRTISGLVGMVFRKPPTEVMPPAVTPMLDDIDMQGTPFNVFVNNVTTDVLTTGRLGLLVDHPAALVNPDGSTPTVAQVQAAGLRPFLAMYAAEASINWKTRRVNNKQVLSLVVLKETAALPKDEFEDTDEQQYRVLALDPKTNLYRVRLFKIGLDGKDQQIGVDLFPLMNNAPMTEIPFIFIGVNGVDIDADEPPLIDLADLNLSHYRTSADYEHGCHFTALPTAWIAGYADTVDGQGKPVTKSFHIGSPVVWTFADPNAKAEFLEFKGQGLTTLKENLDRKEQQMAVLGARMLAAEKKQAETATTSAIHRSGENSILASIAISISLAVKRAMDIFSLWAGGTPNVEFDLNRDFMPVPMEPAQLSALVGAWQAGALSTEDLFENLQRGDVIDSKKTLEEQQAEIAATPPPLPVGVADPNAVDEEDEEDDAPPA